MITRANCETTFQGDCILNKTLSLSNLELNFRKITHSFRLGTGIEQIQKVQLDTDRLRSQVEDAGKRAKNEVNQAFQQLCALLEKRKSAMISQIQSDVNEQVGILSDMCTR